MVCWGNPAGGGYGHVAVVETITDTTIMISESSYGGFMFRTRDISRSDLGTGFQGLIYIGDFSLAPPPAPPVNLPPKNPQQKILDRINYETHVSKVGWMNNVADGATSGSTGYGLAVEAIRLSSGDARIDKAIRYQAHVANIGWQDWKNEGEMAGIANQSKRIEAIQCQFIPKS